MSSQEFLLFSVPGHEFTLVKVKLLTALTGATLTIESKQDVELLQLDQTAKGLLLKTTSGFISQHLAILRYIAESYDNSSLLGGADELNRAQINQWLEFAWQELGEASVSSTIVEIT